METVLNKNHSEFITPLSSRGESILNELDRIIAEAQYMKKTFQRGYDMCEPTKTDSCFGFSFGRDDVKVHRTLS